MANASRHAGDHWESVALQFLVNKGLTLLDRNYHCRMGELDLVMRERNVVVFVEVRFRRQNYFGSGAESVNRHKQRRLDAAARRYLMYHSHLAKAPCRFDVISIGNEQGRVLLNWIKNAFDLTAG